jgi:hypothetical protein
MVDLSSSPGLSRIQYEKERERSAVLAIRVATNVQTHNATLTDKSFILRCLVVVVFGGADRNL